LDIDPMIYWGYLVKARFMAGELYALSSSLVDYIATNPSVQTMVRGAEDKQVCFVFVRWWHSLIRARSDCQMASNASPSQRGKVAK